jgi:hypothetical protein
MPDSKASPTQPPSFAVIARRITGWTTNLLATGILAVLALVVGKQLIAWWQVESVGSSGPHPAAAVPLADIGAGGPLELGFGHMPYQIQCRNVRGNAQAATDALVAICRELATENSAVFPDFGSAEAGLLKLAARATPVARGPGEIEVFASSEGMPLVVVSSAATGGSDAMPGGTQVAPQLGAGQRRVVTWGLAASAAEGEWNLYVAHASRRSQRTTSHDADRSPARTSQDGGSPGAVSRDTVPIPPGSQRSLAMWDAHGGGLSAFAGNGRAEDWVAFYSAWFGQQPWIVSQPWRHFGGCWHARYERAGSSGRETVDVQFGPNGPFGSGGQSGRETAAGLVGLISIAGAEPPAGK